MTISRHSCGFLEHAFLQVLHSACRELWTLFPPSGTLIGDVTGPLCSSTLAHPGHSLPAWPDPFRGASLLSRLTCSLQVLGSYPLQDALSLCFSFGRAPIVTRFALFPNWP